MIHFAEAEIIAGPTIADYVEGKIDSVYLIYNEFKSVIQQRVVIEPLLPFPAIEDDAAAAAGDPSTTSTSRRRSGSSTNSSSI